MGRSLRKAIDAYCKMCIYDPLAELGAWRQQTEGCPSEKSCPMWEVRPLSRSDRVVELKVKQFGSSPRYQTEKLP